MTIDPKNWLWWLEGKLLGIWKVFSHSVLLLDSNGEPPNAPAINMVAPLEAAYNEPEGRFDLSIAAAALIPEVDTNRTVWLDVINGDDITGEAGSQTKAFATLPAAITALQGLLPSAAQPALLKIHPGTVTTAPFTLPSHCTITATDGPETVIIEASTATAALCTLSLSSHVKNLTFKGASGVGGVGVLCSTAATDPSEWPQIERCIFRDCTTGLKVSGANVVAFQWSCEAKRLAGETLSVGFEASSGGTLLGRIANALGVPGSPIDRAFYANGSGSQLILAEAFAVLSTNGFYCSDSALMITASAAFQFCNYAVRVAASGGEIRLGPCSMQSSIVRDIYTESNSGNVSTNNAILEIPPDVAAGAEFFGIWHDLTCRDVVVEGALLRIGAALRPTATALGGGGDHTDQLAALRWDPAAPGVFDDITAEIVSSSGSTTPVFLASAADNILYLGGPIPFPGLFVDTTLLTTSTSIVLEYWNGATWEPLRWMTTLAESPYTSSGNSIFAAADQHRVRWELPSDWATETIESLLRYWMRFRVDTTPLSVIPQVEHMRLDTSSSAFGADGFLERRGAARTLQLLPNGDALPIRWWASGVAPSTTDIAVTTGGIVVRTYSMTNASTKQINRFFVVPPGLDTSMPVRVEIDWDPEAAGAGVVGWTVRARLFKTGDLLNGTLVGTATTIASPSSGVQYQSVRAVAELSIPQAESGRQTLAIQVQRQGGVAPDTLATSARLISIRVLGWYWAPGEQEA